MKGNIKKLAVFVMIAAITMFIVVGIASADDDTGKKSIHGEYAVTAGMSCIYTPAALGFNNKLQTDPTAVGSNKITLQGIATFNHNGTGKFDSTGVEIDPPPVLPIPGALPCANAFHFSFTFTYNVADDDTITINADTNSFTVTYDTGPITGVTFTADKYSLSGMVSADHKTLTLGPPTTLIQTSTFRLPPPASTIILVLKMICNGSYVFTRLDQ